MFGISLDGMIFVSFLSAQLIHRQKRKKNRLHLVIYLLQLKLISFEKSTKSLKRVPKILSKNQKLLSIR